MTRYAARVDANQAQVVSALRAVDGARVWIIGLPVDLLVGYTHSSGDKRFWFVEVKDGAKVPSARKKTGKQEKFFDDFPGWPVSLVDGPEAAVRHLETLVGEA